MRTKVAKMHALLLAALIVMSSGTALAQPLSYAPPSAAVIEDAPPTVRKLLQDASALESAPDTISEK